MLILYSVLYIIDLDKYLRVSIIVGLTMLVICTWLITDFCLFHREKVKQREKKTASAPVKKPKRLQMHHLSAPVSSDLQECSRELQVTGKTPRCLIPMQESLSSPAENRFIPKQHKLKKKLKAKAVNSPRNLQRKSSDEKGSFRLSEDEELDLFPVIRNDKQDESVENETDVPSDSVNQ